MQTVAAHGFMLIAKHFWAGHDEGCAWHEFGTGTTQRHELGGRAMMSRLAPWQITLIGMATGAALFGAGMVFAKFF
jgi:hypothetical protein